MWVKYEHGESTSDTMESQWIKIHFNIWRHIEEEDQEDLTYERPTLTPNKNIGIGRLCKTLGHVQFLLSTISAQGNYYVVKEREGKGRRYG